MPIEMQASGLSAKAAINFLNQLASSPRLAVDPKNGQMINLGRSAYLIERLKEHFNLPSSTNPKLLESKVVDWLNREGFLLSTSDAGKLITIARRIGLILESPESQKAHGKLWKLIEPHVRTQLHLYPAPASSYFGLAALWAAVGISTTSYVFFLHSPKGAEKETGKADTIDKTSTPNENKGKPASTEAGSEQFKESHKRVGEPHIDKLCTDDDAGRVFSSSVLEKVNGNQVNSDTPAEEDSPAPGQQYNERDLALSNLTLNSSPLLVSNEYPNLSFERAICPLNMSLTSTADVTAVHSPSNINFTTLAYGLAAVVIVVACGVFVCLKSRRDRFKGGLEEAVTQSDEADHSTIPDVNKVSVPESQTVSHLATPHRQEYRVIASVQEAQKVSHLATLPRSKHRGIQRGRKREKRGFGSPPAAIMTPLKDTDKQYKEYCEARKNRQTNIPIMDRLTDMNPFIEMDRLTDLFHRALGGFARQIMAEVNAKRAEAFGDEVKASHERARANEEADEALEAVKKINAAR